MSLQVYHRGSPTHRVEFQKVVWTDSASFCSVILYVKWIWVTWVDKQTSCQSIVDDRPASGSVECWTRCAPRSHCRDGFPWSPVGALMHCSVHNTLVNSPTTDLQLVWPDVIIRTASLTRCSATHSKSGEMFLYLQLVWPDVLIPTASLARCSSTYS